MNKNKIPRVLVIAGSDSSGGAGIQADIKTLTAFKVFSMTAITAITAQNTNGVSSVESVSLDLIKKQIEDCISDIGVDAIKIGMVNKAEIFDLIFEALRKYQIIKKGIPIIGLIGRQNSTLSKEADIFLDVSVEKEACTLDLAPTASTTATLAMGDALAIALLEVRGFNKEDFAELHPGGMLGKRLLLTIDQLSHKGNAIPFTHIRSSIKDALFNISEKGLGLTGVLDENDCLVGIITDGDIRRGLEKFGDEILSKTSEFLMSEKPKWISSETLAISALELMEKHSITSLFVFSDPSLKKPDGIVHIHDILKSGIQ